jgi:hypothetical protein
MRLLQRVAVGLLQAIATVLVLAYPIGILVACCGLVYVTCWDIKWADLAIPRFVVRFEIYAIVYGFLLLPAGVLLHGIIARMTGIFARWVWGAIFVGSAITCAEFPLGTIVGVGTIYVLFTSDTFVRMRRCDGISKRAMKTAASGPSAES